MAAVTTGVVLGGASLYQGYRQGEAAEDAARAQARGVQNAQRATIEATNRARQALTSGRAYNPELEALQAQLADLQGQQQAFTDQFGVPQSPKALEPGKAGPLDSLAVTPQAQPSLQKLPLPSGFGAISMPNLVQSAIQSSTRGGRGSMIDALGDLQGGKELAGTGEQRFFDRQNEIQALQNQIAGIESGLPEVVDPRQELLRGIEGQLGFTGQGFSQAQQTLSPLADLAAPYLSEQFNLMGLGGDEAYQQALNRVADPLAAAQERSFLRNNAALGGVGGNALSALAEQTRSRTEANIGNRLAQLGSASAPSLNALQQISNLRLNQGLSMADIMGGGGRDLSAQETARRQALANVELGQGSELAQLAQNLGTAQAGGAAFAAQNPSPLTQGLMGGLSGFLGAGGSFGGFGGGTTAMNVQNPNIFGNFA